ncbi:MAG: hypothetical protein ACYCYI_06795 [Saccharofermentanales bacterium]
MKCQRCQNKEATILIKQFINGKEQEYKLCPSCMKELGYANIYGLDLDNFLAGGAANPQQFTGAYNQPNMSGLYNSGVFVPGKHEVKACAHCNTTLDDIHRKGKLGCSYCYETFEDQLAQVFRRIQSGDTHRGRQLAESKENSEINKIISQNNELQQKIKEAVEIEDYENAAKYKMQILQNRERIAGLEKIKSDNDIESAKPYLDSGKSEKKKRTANPAKNETKKPPEKKKGDDAR